MNPNTPSANGRAFLLASLLLTADEDAVTFDDESYFDWSTELKDASGFVIGRRLEAGDEDGDAVQIDMTWERIERLQRALTLTLANRSVEVDRDSAMTSAQLENWDRKQKALGA